MIIISLSYLHRVPDSITVPKLRDILKPCGAITSVYINRGKGRVEFQDHAGIVQALRIGTFKNTEGTKRFAEDEAEEKDLDVHEFTASEILYLVDASFESFLYQNVMRQLLAHYILIKKTLKGSKNIILISLLLKRTERSSH